MLMQCKKTGVVGLMLGWGEIGYSCFCHNTRGKRSWEAATHGHKPSTEICLKYGYKCGWNYKNSEVKELFAPLVLENV